MSDKTSADLSKMTFEQAMSELEGIVTRLERAEVALEESITLYERGEKLRAHCDTLLKNAEMRVEKLKTDASGAATGTESFEASQ